MTGATPEGAKLAAVCHFSIQVFPYFDILAHSLTSFTFWDHFLSINISIHISAWRTEKCIKGGYVTDRKFHIGFVLGKIFFGLYIFTVVFN